MMPLLKSRGFLFAVLGALLLALAACAGETVGDVAWRTLENGLRGACEAAGNCRNECAGGEPWRAGPIRCP